MRLALSNTKPQISTPAVRLPKSAVSLTDVKLSSGSKLYTFEVFFVGP